MYCSNCYEDVGSDDWCSECGKNKGSLSKEQLWAELEARLGTVGKLIATLIRLGTDS